MNYKVYDLVRPTRSEWGRVVITPPGGSMGDLMHEKKSTFFWCCNRAFLTEECYKKHIETKDEHKKDVDFTTLPRWDPFAVLGKAIHEKGSIPFWRCRKINKNKEELNDTGISDADGTDKMECEENIENDKTNSEKPLKSPYICPICKLQIHLSNKRRHNESHHVKNGKYPCPNCPCVFLSETKLHNHQYRDHQVEGKNTSAVIKNALIAKTNKKPVRSQETFSNQQKSRKKNLCLECGKCFDDSHQLKEHHNTHTGNRPYKCDLCGFKFAHIANLRRHMRVAHTENDKYFCETCNCSFSSNQLLVRHKTIIHRPKEDSQAVKKTELESPKLERIAPEQNPSLISHSRSTSPSESVQLPNLTLQHPGPNTNSLYECPVCHKELSSPQTWRGHMLIHQNLKPYVCKLCGQSFRLHGTRSQHIQTCHSGPFACKLCTCRFRHRRGLLRHHRASHGKFKVVVKNQSVSDQEQPRNHVDQNPDFGEVVANLRCQKCGRFVKTMDEFQKHKLEHETPLRGQCGLCLKLFNNANNVGSHKRTSHVNGNHKCCFCCCRYQNTGALFRHLVSMHGMLRTDWNFLKKCIKPASVKRLMIERYKLDVGEDSQPSKLSQDITSVMKNLDSEPATPFPFRVLDTLEGTVPCAICSANIRKKNIHFHMKRSHHNNGKFNCDKCPCRFLTNNGLSRHKLLYHKTTESQITPVKNLQIGQNTEPFKSKVEHFNVPEVSKLRYLCTYCDKTFSNKRILSYHMHSHKYGRTFKCDKCPMAFSLPSTLRNHTRTSHSIKAKFKCSKCPCKFMSASGLVNHTKFHAVVENEQIRSAVNLDILPSSTNGTVSTVSNGSLLQCPVCMKSMNKYYLNTHLQIHNRLPNEMKYECNICHQKFSNSSSIPAHKRLNHFHDGKFRCAECPCKFKTESGLKHHIAKHHRNKKSPQPSVQVEELLCDPTPEEGPSTSIQPMHNRQCPYCLKVLSSEKHLGLHIQIHLRSEGEMKFECNICHQKFSHPESIRSHKKANHFHDGKFKCAKCPCKFKTELALKCHFGKHHQKRKENATPLQALTLPIPTPAEQQPSTVANVHQSQCPYCYKILSSGKSLEIHLRIHSRKNGEKKFKCNLCQLKFLHKASVFNHKKKSHFHNGKFNCTACSCKFLSAGGLLVHKTKFHSSSTKHRRPATFQCTFCDKILSRKYFRDHMLLHSRKGDTGDPKNYKCDMCEMKFSHPDSILKHKKTCHSHNGEHECNLCPCKFETANGLDWHLRRFHGQSNEVIKLNRDLQKMQETLVTEQQTDERSDERPEEIEREPTICHLCNLPLGGATKLSQHIKSSHVAEGLFKCLSCSCKFTTFRGLTRHAHYYHKVKVKPGKFPEESEFKLSRPIKIMKPVSSILSTFTMAQKVLKNSIKRNGHLKCSLCGAGFDRKFFLDKHMQVAHTNGIYKCPQCVCSFHSSSGLQSHINGRHNRATPNDTLDEVVLTAENKDVSYTSDSNSGQPKCELCGFTFKDHNGLIQHKNVAHSGGKYKCTKCSCCFSTSLGLVKHLSWKHGANRRRRKSPEPKVNAASSMDISETIEPPRAHARKNADHCVCEICGMVVHRKAYLAKHQQVAHSNGRYKCKKCVCCFHTLVGLTKHTLWHSKNSVMKTSHSTSVISNYKTNSSIGRGGFTKVDKSSLKIRAPFKQHFYGSQKFYFRPALSTENRRHKCNLCGLRFADMRYLRRHMKQAHSNGGYRCKLCICSFFSMKGLAAHKRVYHNSLSNEEVRDDIDNTDENEMTSLNSPEEDAMSSSQSQEMYPSRPPRGSLPAQSYRFKCDFCGLRFTHRSYLNRHHENAHTGGAHGCDKCSCSFSNVIKLAAHKRVYHNFYANGGLKLLAKIKNRTSNNRSINSTTNDHHTQDKLSAGSFRKATSRTDYKFRCTMCRLKFTQKLYFDRHLEKAHTNGGHNCEICPCSFMSAKELGAHKRSYHSQKNGRGIYRDEEHEELVPNGSDIPETTPHLEPETKNFECQECGIIFKKGRSLQDHKENAHSGGPHICELCPCSFHSTSSLSAHKRHRHKITEDDNVSLSDQNQIQANLRPSTSRSRTPVSPISNPPVYSSTSSEMYNHQEMSTENPEEHSDVAMFQCSYCSKLFKSQKLVDKHLLCHTRPVECVDCNARFRTNDELTKHSKTAHGNGEYQCFICSCRFMTDTGRKQHMTFVHKNQKSSAWRKDVDNIVIEHEQENYYEEEPFIRVDSTYSQQMEYEESQPIVEGIMETNWNGINNDAGAGQNNQYNAESCDTVDSYNTENESEPIIQGILEFSSGSHVDKEVTDEFHAPAPPPPQPLRVARKKTYSPKNRPMACTKCGDICLGPEKLRLHMESHNETGSENQMEDSEEHNESTTEESKCAKCGVSFTSTDELSRHLEFEHDESGLYRCVYCPCMMKTEANLRYHFTTHHTGK